MDSLATTLVGTPDNQDGLKYGIVTAVSPIAVLVGAASTPSECRSLSSYAPALGDFVAVLVSGPDRLILGKTSPVGQAALPPGLNFTSNWLDADPYDPGFYLTGDNLAVKPAGYSVLHNRYSVSPEGTVNWTVSILLTDISNINLGVGFNQIFEVRGFPLPVGPPYLDDLLPGNLPNPRGGGNFILGLGTYGQSQHTGSTFPLLAYYNAQTVDGLHIPNMKFHAMVQDPWEFMRPTVGFGEPGFVLAQFDRVAWNVSYEVG